MAVKKQTSRSSKKPKETTAKKVAKKAAAKKNAPKKTARKAAKKAVAKKTPPRTKATASKSSKPKKHKDESTKSSIDTAVRLPQNMSKRSKAKAEAIRIDMAEEWRKSFLRIAYASGLCFVLLGFAISSLANFPGFNISGQTGLLAATTDTATGVTQAATQPLPVTFQLTSQLPDKITSSERITFTATNAELVQASLLPAPCDGSTGFLTLNPENVSGDKYRVTINPLTYQPGYYCFRVNIKPIGSQSAFDIKNYGGNKQIRIGPDEAFTTSSGGSTGANSGQDSADDDSDEVDITEIESTTPAFDSADVEELVPVEQSGRVFAIFSDKTTLSGVVTIGVSVPDDLQFIELYARPTNSLNSRFVGLATIRFGRFQFVVNTPDRLPNGTYEFYAQGKDSAGKMFKTESLTLRVTNQTTSVTPTPTSGSGNNPAPTPTRPNPTDVSPVSFVPNPTDDSTEVDSDTAEEREFFALPEVNDEVLTPSEEKTEAALKANRSDIDQLLKNYASAKQSGDEVVISAAREALNEKRQAIVNESLNDPDSRELSDDIDEKLAARIEDLQKRVDRFEEVRRERSSGDTAIDTDEDGIPDVDERILYGTDPNAADSDNDGVADGIEIVRGFNPNSDEPEAIIRFESPRESIGLVRDDVLAINEVSPIVPVERQPNEPDVLTEIRGKALPNSFVTLYIFSTPVVVTVKTDADGSFVYTLDKELEDGAHDVFVAVTDNTGSIIAQSNAFSFVKEAQAFTPVDAADNEVISSQTAIESSNQSSYGTVAGLGILAFGLILIMLGVSLRKRPEEVEMTTPVGNGDDSDEESSDDEATPKPAAVSQRKFDHIDAS